METNGNPGNEQETVDRTKAATDTLMAGAHKATDLWWQGWRQAVQMLNWTGTQTERVMHTLIDQGHVSREEAQKLQQEFADQAQASQAEFSRITREAVDEAMKVYQQTTEQQLSALMDRMEDLGRRMEELRERLEKSPR